MHRIGFFTAHIKKNIYLYIILLLFGFIYIYHFDYSTLGSWDEAWYGSISRQMIKSGDYMHMNWNGKPFFDHPPMGMWLTAVSYHLFGINEFSTRFPSVLLGLLSVVFMYKTGELLFKQKVVGAAAALILGTCVWYVLRVRSGNLDSPFVFFYILTVFLALKAEKNFTYFPFTMLSFAALMLTKTLVGLSIIPLILLAIYPQLLHIRKNWKWFLLGVGAFLALAGPWYIVHYLTYPDFIQQHIINIGTRNKTLDSYFKLNSELPLFYLHMGIRKWYYLWLLAAGYLIITLRFLKKSVLFILLWNLLVLYPFLTTDQTHIWHLIPVYIPVAFVVAYGLYDAGMLAILIIKKIKIQSLQQITKKILVPHLVHIIFFLAISFIAVWQIKVFYPEVMTQNRYTPDDVDIARRVAKYDKQIYLDDDYLPLAVFYSGRFMRQMAWEPEERKTLVNLFRSGEKDFVVITRSWAVNNLKDASIEYTVLEENNSFSILTRKK